jgi:hypothetical protein
MDLLPTLLQLQDPLRLSNYPGSIVSHESRRAAGSTAPFPEILQRSKLAGTGQEYRSPIMIPRLCRTMWDYPEVDVLPRQQFPCSKC